MKYPADYPEILSDKFKTLFFVDIETTGTDYWRNEILTWSMSAVDYYSLEQIDEIELTFKPHNLKFWSRDSEKIHKIPLSKALYFEDKMTSSLKALEFIEKYSFNSPQVLVCHAFDKYRNGDLFDANMIKWHMEKLGLRFRYQKSIRFTQSTATFFLEAKKQGYHVSDKLFSQEDEEKGVALKVLCKKYGIALDHHNAKSDRQACYELYKIARAFGEKDKNII